MPVVGIDHVQLAMPAGGEDAATAFYEGLLGRPRRPKPQPLAARGGCWFESEGVKVHLGVEADFRPARKAHPALVVDDLAGLCDRLRDAGVEVRDGDDPSGRPQAYVEGPLRQPDRARRLIRRGVPQRKAHSPTWSGSTSSWPTQASALGARLITSTEKGGTSASRSTSGVP